MYIGMQVREGRIKERTYGLVNAHLISGISTKHTKPG